MTHTERQARYRTEQAETHAAPSQPADRRHRLQRLRDVVAKLQELQRAYQARLDALPRNIQMGLGCALRSQSF